MARKLEELNAAQSSEYDDDDFDGMWDELY